MIARIWHGWTTPDNADVYENLLRTEILPGIAARNIPGYHGPHLLRRPVGDEIEFVTILWFDSLDGVKALSGDDYETAYVPQQARDVLNRFDARSAHYDVAICPPAPLPPCPPAGSAGRQGGREAERQRGRTAC